MSLSNATRQRLSVEAPTGSDGGRELPHEGSRKPGPCQENIEAKPRTPASGPIPASASPRGRRDPNVKYAPLGLPCLRFHRVARQAADSFVGPAAVSSWSRRRGCAQRDGRYGHRRALVKAARFHFLFLRRGCWGRCLLTVYVSGKALGRQ